MKNMVDKRVIIAGVFIIFVALAVAVSMKSDESPGVIVPNTKAPPEIQPIPETTTVQVLTLADDTSGITCQQPPKDNEYGGIGGSENNPPKGTVVDPDLTKIYGRPTATGACGTYWYVVGWWFNATEMSKLPPDTLLHGISPYAIISGSSESTQVSDSGGDEPIAPVPEMPVVILVSFGIFMLVAWKKMKNK